MVRSFALLAVLLLVAAPGCASPSSGRIALSASTTRDLAAGVFEVVIPRVEDTPGTKYAIPLPFELLPFAQRNEMLRGIGTAFAISRTRFVSAAHVMPLLGASAERYFLRDSGGATYEIGRIVKYSKYRDLVEFELVTPIPNVLPLVPRNDVEIGELVLTVGNAIGEGIVARAGALTSRTPEPVDGAWSFLRYTSPASPGNSGGPLIDGAGRVVGVVVQKSPAENLNLAVPIAELAAVSTATSDYGAKGVRFDEDHKEMLANWVASSPLPDSLASLRVATKQSGYEFFQAKLGEFDAKFGKETFPNAPRLGAYLRQPLVRSGLGHVTVDPTGTWAITETSYASKELAPGYFGEFFADSRTSGQIMLTRPPGAALARFFASPKLLADALLRNYEWTISFAGRPVRVETLGEPARTDRWVDEYGRPWFTFVWPIRRADEVLELDCLTNAAGWACYWEKAPAPNEAFLSIWAKRRARRTTMAYFGHLVDWAEFLALPETHRPPIFAGASVRLDGGLTFAFRPFAGKIDLPAWSSASLLDVFVVPEPPPALTQRILEITLRPEPAVKTFTLSLTALSSPRDGMLPGYADAWQKLRTSAAPFDNVLKTDGGAGTIQRAIDRAPPAGADRGYFTTCHSRTDYTKVDLRSACTKLQEGVRIIGEPGPRGP